MKPHTSDASAKENAKLTEKASGTGAEMAALRQRMAALEARLAGDTPIPSGRPTGSPKTRANVGVLLTSIAALTVLAGAGIVYGEEALNALFVDGNGNVGIGTTSPLAKLDVRGNANVAGALTVKGDGTGLAHGSTDGAVQFSTWIGPDQVNVGTTTKTKLILVSNNGGGQAHLLPNGDFLVTNGNVGIGTTSPLAKLDVRGNANVAGALTVKGDGTGLAHGSTDGAVQFSTWIGPDQVNVGTTTKTKLILVSNNGGGQAHLLPNGDFLVINGNVGIGTTTPTKGKVEINGSMTTIGFKERFGMLLTTGAAKSDDQNDRSLSLYANAGIAASQVFAFSDERIKRIEGRSDAKRDLATLLGIEVTDYTEIDTVNNGTGKQKKVVAQQVERVFPQAVRRSTDVVPDIYQKATIEGGWVKLATNLKKGERVRVIGEKLEGIHEVLEVAQDKFRIDFAADGNEVFVYGREVNDFGSVDYGAVAMLNVSATQELAKRLEKLEKREAHLAELEQKAARVASLEQNVADLKRMITQLAEASRASEHSAQATHFATIRTR